MTFFFYFLGASTEDSHDPGLDAKRLRKIKDEEELLRYLLKQQEKEKKPKLEAKLDKDSIRETLEKHFKGEESEKLLELVAQEEVRTARDLFNAYLAITNKKRIQVLMTLIMLDEEDQEYEH
jgi:hypothetical protein